MNIIRLVFFLVLLTRTVLSSAEIVRINDGGVSVDLEQLLPGGEPAVLLFHTPWDQDSLQLIEEIEQWASSYPNLKIFVIDVADQRTQVYRQFSLEKIPSIIIFKDNLQQAGGFIYDIDALESALLDARII